MKLGVAYNVFDGIELLESSINNIRSEVDYICVIYQKTSNIGMRIDGCMFQYMLSKIADLVDCFYEYKPNLLLDGCGNEINKRNIGLELCRGEKCTHFMSMDVDEFYVKDEFINAKRMLDNTNYDGSTCMMQEYYGDNEHTFLPNDKYVVSFIYKITDNIFKYGTYFPNNVDPTRRIKCGNIKIFDRSELQMHHMTWVRNDIRMKMLNSSGRNKYGTDDEINSVVDYYNNWQDGMDAFFQSGKHKLIKIKPYIEMEVIKWK